MQKSVLDDILLQMKNERTDKARYSIYVSKPIFNRFREFCGEFSVSRVLEYMMKRESETDQDLKARKKK